ncbi:hypothetical protein DFH08DRAFT_744633 [Mycena albidolilacea]|uniref:DUF5071 domain-containing protein n=1 Tax=Mycena albidolilacea TaxID=1033008 RepID=A0AAD7ESW4_9AGAR|nr:hypothetical protein DFH08DRAFT_744633 [Mycena albidolilacea]
MSTDAGRGVVFEFQHTPESQILPKLSSLSSADLAPLIPLLLSWLVYPSTSAERDTLKDLSNETRDQLADFLISRLTAASPTTGDPLVAQIHAALSNPSGTADSAREKAALFYYHGVMLSLPKEHIEPYCDALTRMAWTSTAEETARGLDLRCRYLLEFLDSSQARVPHSKSDELAVRSLELVRTAEEMCPLIPGVLEWIADMNWPIAQECWDQLARFPELTIEPIRAVLRRGDDGGWAMNILSFLLDDVPRVLMERLRPEIERIAQRPTDDEIECMCFESAAECLEAMDHWAARMKILRWPEGQSLHRHRT